jgi:hypothetical protein
MNADKFRKLALSLPDAVESAHMNHPDFRIGGKIFATLGFPDESWAMVKVTPQQLESLRAADSESFRPCNGAWGQRGCTNVRLASAKTSLVSAALKLAAENVASARRPTRSKRPTTRRNKAAPRSRKSK